MFIFYDLIFLLISIFYLPLYLFRGKFHRGFFARLGILPKGLKLDRPIWIHAVSVGEAIMMRPLLEKLRQEFPDKQFVISTVTATGNRIAKGLAKEQDLVTYLPLDFSFIVRSVLKRVNPSLFVIAETELWPNLILALDKQHIPVVVVNGRISDSSFKGYSRIKFLLAPFLKKVTKFLVQSERDRTRLLALGVGEEKVQVTGNMKFDAMQSAIKREDPELRKKLGLLAEERLFVAGSTHPGEEKAVFSAFNKLAQKYQGNLRLLVAPRHPERAQEAVKLAKAFGFNPVLISQAGPKPSAAAVFILDTVGQLLQYYAIADIVFMGGSLVKKGGHNILEPALFAKPILFGKHMFNFRDIAELFLQNRAAILLQNKEELYLKTKILFDNPALRQQMGNCGRQLVIDNQGAAARNLNVIKEIMVLE